MSSPSGPRRDRLRPPRRLRLLRRHGPQRRHRTSAATASPPVQLLEAALAACAALTAEQLIVRRTGADFTVVATGTEAAHEVTSVDVTFALPADEPLATVIPRAVARECKVSRTVEHGAPVAVHLDPDLRQP
ncbi:OsmC family protein [Kutzneria sp. 744]|uniref:OsmC family protein n=1 Tax=Kutzneria sp. (strain 744) TaxID=345341 RepID=UPI000A03FCAE